MQYNTNPAGHAYAVTYIPTILNKDQVSEPDLTLANGTSELLTALHGAHRHGGVEAARAAWEVLRRAINPEVARLVEVQSKLIYADELRSISKPAYLVEEYPFYHFAFNVVVGPSGGGQPFIALDFVCRAIQKQPHVAHIAGEGLHGYASRWEVLKDHLNLHDFAQYLTFYCEPVQI